MYTMYTITMYATPLYSGAAQIAPHMWIYTWMLIFTISTSSIHSDHVDRRLCYGKTRAVEE